jgi:Domain of unknown function (DUF927)
MKGAHESSDPATQATTNGTQPGGQGRSKRDRAYDLARNRLQLRRAAHGWPYAQRGDRLYRFDGAGKSGLYADIRHAWRTAHDDDPPDDRTLASVVADLRRKAEDAPADDERATAWLAERGVAAGPPRPSADRGLATLTALTGCPLPDGYTIPAPYTVAPGGVWIWTPRGDAERAAWSALLVGRVFTDPEGEQMVELVWLDRGRWRTRIVPRSIAKSGRRLVAQLGDAGLPVTEADAKTAERWLAAVEAANLQAITEVTIARHLGWQADGEFVTANGAPYAVEGIEPQMMRALAAHHERGTPSGWQTAIKLLEGYPQALMAVYGGLAAPLLQVLGVGSFTINWGGTSTTGKTTAAQGGLSCWADPDESAGAITSWSATATAYQARLALAGNGVPVLFDDTQTAGKPETVSDALYQITQNQGKGRMGAWKSYRWRTIVLSTGERSALSFSTAQGVSARVLDLQGAPFGRTESSGDDARAFREGITANYGLAGPAFLERLRAELDQHGKGPLAERHEALTEAHRKDASDLARRRAPLVAVLRLAAERAHAWGIVPFLPPEHQVWLKLFAADDPRDNRAEMALDVVREYIAVNSDKICGPYGTGHTPTTGWIGIDTTVGDDDKAVALVPQRLREALARAGYELDAVLQGWRELGALHEMNSQRPPYLIGRRIEGRKTKCFVFAGWVLHGNDAED